MSTHLATRRLLPDPRYNEATTETTVSLDEIENALSPLFESATVEGNPAARKPLRDSEFPRIARFLQLAGKHDWSLRPRTYAILRMVDRLDIMDSFVAEGLYDISFPYSPETLPRALRKSTDQAKFLELQTLVLTTQALDVESGGRRHRHLGEDGDVHFQPIKSLGRGGFGVVDHVWSRLSLSEFARKRMPRGKTFQKDKSMISEFERELTILKRLSHHHLVKFIGSYTDPNYVGLIMSPVADCDLAEFLQPDPLPKERLFHIRHFYGCLISALEYLHDNKIRHKDVKPGNILVHGSNVLLTDFGTSLDWTEKGHSTTMDQPSAMSLPYCSPEVAEYEVCHIMPN